MLFYISSAALHWLMSRGVRTKHELWQQHDSPNGLLAFFHKLLANFETVLQVPVLGRRLTYPSLGCGFFLKIEPIPHGQVLEGTAVFGLDARLRPVSDRRFVEDRRGNTNPKFPSS